MLLSHVSNIYLHIIYYYPAVSSIYYVCLCNLELRFENDDDANEVWGLRLGSLHMINLQCVPQKNIRLFIF